MNRVIGGIVLSVALISGAQAADQALLQQGKSAFEYHCAACHGETVISGHRHLPGTEALMVKYHGVKPGALQDRTDLPPELIKQFVRNGVSVMPFFRKTMVTDAEVNAIAAYLSRHYHAPGDKGG